jgi:hypothetical protein
MKIIKEDSNKPSNGRGGYRQGAGRKAGSVTRKTRELAEQFIKSGAATPLEVMIKTMHELLEAAEHINAESESDIGAVSEERVKLLNMAAAIARYAAPYLHPRLSAIEHTGKNGAPLQSGVLVVPQTLSAADWEKTSQS